jgi:hypothetical protein
MELPVDTYRWLSLRGAVVTSGCAYREDRTVLYRYSLDVVTVVANHSQLVRRLRYKGVMVEVRQINISTMPDEVRLAVIAEARERDMSLSSLVTEIVGACHGLRYDHGAQRRQRLREGTTGELPWVLRIPAELALALAQAQQANGGRRVAKQRLIVSCLAEHYGIETESPLNRSLAQPRGAGGRFKGRA